MTTDDAPRTPLTMEFAPEPLEGDEHSVPIVVMEPSFQHPGRIFVGVHPFGKRLGLHLLPSDAKKVRDHLSKLLLEPEAELPAETPAPPSSADWQARIRAAAERAQKAKKKRRLGHFRFEAQIGRLVIVLGTQQDD